MRVTYAWFLFIALSTSAADSAAPSGPVRVPETQLDGARLKLPNGLGTVTAPGDEWVWFSIPSPTTPGFICHNSKIGESYAVVINNELDRLDEETANAIFNSSNQTAIKRGMKVTDIAVKASNVPIAGKSFQCGCVLIKSDGRKIHCINYLTLVDRVVLMFHYQVTDEKDPEGFTTFVKSLKALK